MLRTNISTRPFYNERRVHALLLAVGLVVLALTIFNVSRIVSLTSRQAELGRTAASAEQRARDLRADAGRVRGGIDSKQLGAISGAAREANAIIAQRLFSWTDLLNRFETTLPDGVRISSMRPRIEHDSTVTIQMSVVGRDVEEINQFMERLEGTGAFADVFSREEITSEDGLIQATLEGRYAPAAGAPPAGKP